MSNQKKRMSGAMRPFHMIEFLSIAFLAAFLRRRKLQRVPVNCLSRCLPEEEVVLCNGVCGCLRWKSGVAAKSIFKQNTEQADSHFRKVEGMYACSVRANRPHRARQSAPERSVGMVRLLGESHDPN